MCFSWNLEQCEPVKYSKNAVGSFKNTMYRKSKKINPRLDFSWIFTLFLVTFLKIFAFFYEKKSVMKIIEKKMATNSPRDAEKLFQNEGHDVYNAFCERRAPPGVLK
jgi:hypothetical protein